MPTTFSTAFPAMATMTKPANACEIPSVWIIGSSAATNHSETNAAINPQATSVVTDRRIDQVAVSGVVVSGGTIADVALSEYGMLTMKPARSRQAAAAESAGMW